MPIRSSKLRTGAVALTASLGVTGLMMLPAATAAQADDYYSIGLYWGSYSMVPDAGGGTFRLMSKENPDQCLAADSSGGIANAPCGGASHWNLQPNSSADKILIRHAGDNKCTTGTGRSLTDCNSGDADAFDTVLNPLPKELTLSRKAAIGLGENHVMVCNHAGYNTRAVIDYQVQNDPGSDAETRGRRVIESFPAGQCRTETLPAGKVTGNVELRRFTNWYMGNYAFYDGDTGSYGGSSNDQLVANWAFAGDHIDGAYNTTGTTCVGTDSNFTAASSANQAASTKKDGATSCTGVNPGEVTASTVAGLLGSVLPMLINVIFS
ncbi:hypothetical protein ACIHAA_21625 [Streptomyces sp. NPDC052040]|uniref:hypothetical protein n=1 Tax=Streptomyces sp. NPDC052040 TaxID=3365682 RepID=UPI0037D11AE4